MSDCTSTRTNITTFVGTVSAAEVREILHNKITDLAGVSRYASGVTITFEMQGDPNAPAAQFTLVQDHDWLLNAPRDA